jgi:hypothetical protein
MVHISVCLWTLFLEWLDNELSANNFPFLAKNILIFIDS